MKLWGPGFVDYDYQDIPDNQKVFSPDRKRALACYVSRHREDRYDNDTDYEIKVWDVATRKQLASITTSCDQSYSTGHCDKDVTSVGFSEDGETIVIRYDDGSEEMRPVVEKRS